MLSMDEREEISRGMAAGVSLRSVARRLGRAPSTISRELERNGGHRLYRTAAADERAWNRALRPKIRKLARCEELRQLVAARLYCSNIPIISKISSAARHIGLASRGSVYSHLAPLDLTEDRLLVSS